MNKICGYSCEHNKGGVCQIPVCDKKLIMSDKTEVQMPIRYIDTAVTELQQNKQLRDNIRQMDNSIDKLQKQLIKEKDNWNKLKEFIKKSLEAIDTIQKLTGNAIENYTPRILTYEQIKDKMQELEESDSNEKNNSI